MSCLDDSRFQRYLTLPSLKKYFYFLNLFLSLRCFERHELFGTVHNLEHLASVRHSGVLPPTGCPDAMSLEKFNFSNSSVKHKDLLRNDAID